MWALPTSYNYDVARVNMVVFLSFGDLRPEPLVRAVTRQSPCCRCQHPGYNAKEQDGSRETLSPREFTGSTAGGRDSVDRRGRAHRVYPTRGGTTRGRLA